MTTMTTLEVSVPTLSTDRLLLRAHCTDDFDAIAAMWSEPEVVKYIGGRPFSREEVWSKLLRYLGHWSAKGFGYWLIVERTTQQVVGEVGLADFKRDLEPSLEGKPEAGWVLSSSAHGKGLATEAVTAALTWFDANFGKAKTVCLIDPANLRSIRVAEKCGYREWTRTTYKGSANILFERS